MKKVYVAQDDDGHGYVIPYELKEKFINLLDETHHAGDSGEYEELDTLESQFELIFGNYATGGDINNIELYANID